MAAPLSRLGQITQAETLINTNTNQDISALDVRNTLTGIIDSTTGMKTIWTGNLKSTFQLQVELDNNQVTKYFSSATRTAVRVVETYADPYFFPPTTTKYLITNSGAGIQGSAAQKNIPTGLVLPAGPVGAFYRFGGGLTFDCVVNTTSLTLSSVSVANPGSGYSSLLLGTDTAWGIVELNFPLVTTKPVVKIQLDTVVAVKAGDSNNGIPGGVATQATFDNVFCFNSPNIATALYTPNGTNYLEAIQVTAIPILYPLNVMTHSVTTGGAYSSTGGFYLNANGALGFNLDLRNSFDADDFLVGPHTVTTSMQIEIKVPIINTTF